MDLTDTPAQLRIRHDIREWLRSHPPETHGPPGAGAPADLARDVAAGRDWQARLAAGGWVALTWPLGYGGRAMGPVESFVVQEELARAGAPELVGRIGVNLVGPTLLAHGTEEQRSRWLPSIPDARELWCQLFSEPAAGSDLAAVQTVATPVRGGYLLQGTKVWTSYAQFADWGLCLARTGPSSAAHGGLTCLAVDMHASGVEVHPLVQMTGEAEFNEVFLSEVEVPESNVIGGEGQGWRVAGSTLSRERGINPRQMAIHLQHIEELVRMAWATGAFCDQRLSTRLAEAYVEVRIFQLLNWRSLSRLAKSLDPGPEGSILKLYWSEMSQRLHALALDVTGPAAPLWRQADANPGGGAWQRSWLYYQAASIFAGTNEIQRNIIGERVLGLPREPPSMTRSH